MRARAGVASEGRPLTTSQGLVAGVVSGVVLLAACTMPPFTHSTPRASPRSTSCRPWLLLKALLPELLLSRLGVLQARGLLLLGSQLERESVPVPLTKPK